MTQPSLCLRARRPRRCSGFGLLEIMVALMIGMFAILIVMKIFAVSETNKRTTTGGNDAQIAGSVALYGLERDIRQAGYGFSAYNILGCSLSFATSADSASVTLAAAPVTINPDTSLVPAGDANTDTLLIAYGTSSSFVSGIALQVGQTPNAMEIGRAHV